MRYFWLQIKLDDNKKTSNAILKNGSSRGQKSSYVFTGPISKKCVYYGENAINIPNKFLVLVGGRGVRVNHDEGTKNKFLEWLINNNEFDIHGMPAKNPDR